MAGLNVPMAVEGSEPLLHSPEPLRRMKRRACVECRQSKLRCDAPVFPCSRCRRLHLQCRLDANYQRMNKNSKIKELEKEVQRLRLIANQQHEPTQTLSASSNAGNQMELMAVGTPPDWALALGNITSRPSITRSDSYPLGQHYPDVASAVNQCNVSLLIPDGESVPRIRKAANMDRAIENVHLRREQIDSLFKIYFDHYHPYLCLLEPSLSPDQCYGNSVLLFWTIISVGARRYQEDTSLLATLSRAINSLLWSTISVRPHTCHTVEAILLQVAWPFPTSTPSVDSSYILCGIAIHAAIQLGCHRPENVQDFSRTKEHLTDVEIGNRAKIWAVCNIISQGTAMGIGQPPTMTFDWTVDRSCEVGNIYSLPRSLRHHLQIQRFCHRLMKTTSENPLDPMGLPNENERHLLLLLLERELDDLTLQIQKDMAEIDQIYLTGARLGLFVFYFFEPTGTTSRKQGLLKAYAAALECISKTMALDSSSNLLAYAPVFMYYLLSLAAFSMLKILDSSYAEYVDFDAGKLAFNSAILGLRRASVVSNDLSGRASEILTMLWRRVDVTGPKSVEEPVLRIRSRFGTSVLHDCVWMWRELFGGQANAYQSPSATSQNRNNSDNALQKDNFFDSMGWSWAFDATAGGQIAGIL